MKKCRKQRGALTIEASISYSIFMMIVVTFLYIMRIVYAYGLIQHAVAQTAKELSMYSYLYQVTGMNDAYQDIKNSTSGRKDQFNTDAGEIVKLYENLQSGNYGELEYNGTLNPKDILKNIGSAMLSEASDEANTQLLTLVARPMMAGYIGADSSEQSADSRLQALRVVGGLNGIDLNSSSLFEDGVTIDLVACYTIDPILPLDIVPELNFSNRAYVRGMSGKTAFQRKESENKKEGVLRMYVNSPEEREIAKNCVAFCSALRRVEQQLRSEENSDAIIDGVLQAAAEFYGASRASIVEADWELGVGIITHEWCADGVEHQKDIQT